MLTDKGPQVMSALTLVLLVSSLSLTAAQDIKYDNICRLLRSGNLIASYTECAAYYKCLDGKAIYEKCETNLYFHKDMQQCVTADVAHCGSVDRKPCENALVGSMDPVPGSCYGYYYCSAKGPERSNCEGGNHFDPGRQSCVYPEQYPCKDEEVNVPPPSSSDPNSTPVHVLNLCQFIRNGVFFGNAGDCKLWSRCTNNVMESRLCSDINPGFPMYNVQLQACDYESGFSCTQVSNDPMLVGDFTLGGKCTEINAQKKAGSCTNYYVCDGDNYRLHTCNAGLFYDAVSERCENRMDARNRCDRCVGSKKTFVNAYSTVDCSGYLYCQNGVQVSEQSCDYGEYFNELSGSCIYGEEPAFACCNPAYQDGGKDTDEKPEETTTIDPDDTTTTEEPEETSTDEPDD